MKKIAGLILLVTLAVLLVVGCGTAKTEKANTGATTEQQDNRKKPTKIRFGYQPAYVLFIVAKEQGWFNDEFGKDGIVLQDEQFIAGPPLIEAFAGGRLDFGLVGDQPAILAKANNIDIKVVGVPLSGAKTLGLVVPNGSEIKSPRDLKGKKVGVVIGSVGHQLLYLYLKANGLTPNDVKQVNMLPPDIKTALAARNIDAAVIWEPWISTIEYEKIGFQVIDATGLKHNANVIIVSNDFAKKYPDIVKRVLKVFVRAEKWVKENPDKTVEIMARATGFKPDILARSLPKFDYNIQLTDEVVTSIADTAKFLGENNITRKDVDIKDLVDASYLKAIGVQ